MTAAGVRTSDGWPVRIAQSQGTCPACPCPIYPGTDIVKPPGRAWQHQRCPSKDRPYRPQRPDQQ